MIIEGQRFDSYSPVLVQENLEIYAIDPQSELTPEERVREELREVFKDVPVVLLSPRGLGYNPDEEKWEAASLRHNKIFPNNAGPIEGEKRADAYAILHMFGVVSDDMEIVIPSGVEPRLHPERVAYNEIMRDALLARGIPKSQIELNGLSLDTLGEEALYLQKIANKKYEKAVRITDHTHESRQRFMHIALKFSGDGVSPRMIDEAQALEETCSSLPVYEVFKDEEMFNQIREYTSRRHGEEPIDEVTAENELKLMDQAHHIARFAPQIFEGLAEDMPNISTLFLERYKERNQGKADVITDWRTIATPEVIEQADKAEITPVYIEDVFRMLPNGDSLVKNFQGVRAWQRSFVGLIMGNAHLRLGLYYAADQNEVMEKLLACKTATEVEEFMIERRAAIVEESREIKQSAIAA